MNLNLFFISHWLRFIKKQNNLNVKGGSRKLFKSLNFLAKAQFFTGVGGGLKLCIQIDTCSENIKILKFKEFNGYIHWVYISIKYTNNICA